MADGSVKIDITADDSEIKKTLDGVSNEAEDAAGGLDKLGDSAEDVGKGFGAADVAIGSFVGNALANLANKVVETIGNIAALADETREYREDMAKLDAAFTTAGHSTETAQKAYDGFYKILGESDRSVEAVNHLAELTKNEEELAQWSTIAAGVTAKFGDSLPIEGLTEAANETAKVGKVTGPLADALNWAGISEDAFNKKLAACNSEQERASLITSTLNGEYAAAAEEYNKLTANTQAARDATNNMEQAQAALGAAIEPVTTAWTNMKANALQWFADVGFPALQSGFQWIQNNLPAIAVIVGGLTAAWLAFGGAQTILNAVQTAGIAIQAALNAVMNANPIGLIILAITALVAGFMLLWNNCEGFRNFWKTMWEGIKVVAKAVSDWFKTAWTATLDWFRDAVAGIKEFFAKAWDGIKNVFNNSIIGQYFKAIWETIKGIFSVVKAVLSGNWSDAWAAIKGIVNTWSGFFSGVWEKIKGVFSTVGGWFSQKFTEAKEKIFNAFSNIKDKFLSIGKNIVDGIWAGISNGYTWIKGKIKEWVGNVVDFCKSILGIKSPSRVFRDEVGAMIAAGIEVGIEENADKPAEALHGVFDSMKKVLDDAHKNTVDTVRDYNAEIADLDKQLVEDKKKKNADIESLEKQHAEKVASIQDNIKKTITDKMQEIVTLGDTYKENVKKIWADLDQSITDLQANYDNQLASRTASIASSLNLWSEATKNTVIATDLADNLKSQVKMLEDYNTAIAKLEERNVSEAFINELKALGVGATGEIEALVRMGDKQLDNYVALWEKKQELARAAAVEELEPLKAETEAKIEELTTAALDKYATLRAEYMAQGSLLMAELKQAMIDAGQGGYEEIIAQIDDYTSAGEDLMSGVVEGIANKSPLVAEAVTRAVNRAIAAAKKAAGIASPSKVMKKEIGYNLADGVAVGWTDKISSLRDKMAGDMQGITARVKAVVMAENSRMAQGVGVRDTGFAEIAQAVGMQTAGINSLASEYRRGSSAQVTVPLILNDRELGRAIVDLGNEENARIGPNLVLA